MLLSKNIDAYFTDADLCCMQVRLNKFSYQNKQSNIEVLVPDAAELQQAWASAATTDPGIAFPYWGKIWSSALALSMFIDEHASILNDKAVLELAGGLGLPAMVAAQYAKHVTGSDYQQAAVDIMRQTVDLNGINNMEVQLLDWRMLELPLSYDIVLFSDVNYEPGLFDELLQVLHQLQQYNTTIFLATPQRLLAKEFMEQLLPQAKRHDIITAAGEDISVVLL